MATLIINFPEQTGARFDLDYYESVHAVLVNEKWKVHGLISVEVLMPMGPQPYRAVVILRFRDQAAIDASMASEGTGAIMADVANFTDIAPILYRAAD